MEARLSLSALITCVLEIIINTHSERILMDSVVEVHVMRPQLILEVPNVHFSGTYRYLNTLYGQ